MTTEDAGETVLRIDGLEIANRYTGEAVVRGLSARVARGGVLGIVGESGSGKTLTCRAVLGILPDLFQVSAGTVELLGHEISGLRPDDWYALRGARIGAVFQDPGSYLNPSIRVGPQVAELLRVRGGLSRRQARNHTLGLFEQVHLEDPARTYQQYPHQLSGGMLQRILIAGAIALEPEVLIADEATTALDVTVQAEILDLLGELRERTGVAMIVVSHDLAVVGQLCEEVLVLKDGEVIEAGPTPDVLFSPREEYTRLLVSEHELYGLERYMKSADTSVEAEHSEEAADA